MSEAPTPCDLTLDIMLMGDSGVGKTSLRLRMINQSFRTTMDSTIGVEFAVWTAEFRGKRAKVQVWDTCGQEVYADVINQYYKRADGILLVYDVRKYSSFESLDKWLTKIRDRARPNTPVVLLGNKIDPGQLHKITKEEGTNYAKANKLTFFETSARDTTNVEEAFNKVVELAYKADSWKQKQKEKKELVEFKHQPRSKKKEKNCCPLM